MPTVHTIRRSSHSARGVYKMAGKEVVHGNAPEGSVCDPVTGMCTMPPRKKEAMTPGPITLPKNLRVLELLEDERGEKVDPEVFKGKVRFSYLAVGMCYFVPQAILPV